MDQKEYKRKWYQENKARILVKQAELRKELVHRIGLAGHGRKAVPIKIRRALIDRAGGKCEGKDHICKGPLGVHHVDGNEKNNELSNLLLLCQRYHRKTDEHIQQSKSQSRDERGRFSLIKCKT